MLCRISAVSESFFAICEGGPVSFELLKVDSFSLVCWGLSGAKRAIEPTQLGVLQTPRTSGPTESVWLAGGGTFMPVRCTLDACKRAS